MNRIKCNFFEPSTKVTRYFRRYQDGDCAGKNSYHNARILRDEIEVPIPADGFETNSLMTNSYPPESLKGKFPEKCDHCNFYFTEKSNYQLDSERLYSSSETNSFVSLQQMPVGGMYFAPWLDGWTTPQLAHVLIVRTPGGLWTIDSQASNCTKPAKQGQKLQSDHHCWIIEGELPNITVSKNGNTCGAGGGSIQCGNYHGFLRNGYLEQC